MPSDSDRRWSLQVVREIGPAFNSSSGIATSKPRWFTRTCWTGDPPPPSGARRTGCFR